MANGLIEESTGDPYTIPLEKIQQLLKGIGIEDMSGLRSVLFEPGQITVERMRRNAEGRAFVLPGRNEVATVTVTIAVEG